jgi:hypothetical protein
MNSSIDSLEITKFFFILDRFLLPFGDKFLFFVDN